MSQRPFPHGLDDPPEVLIWSINDIVPLVVGVALGIVIEQLLICLTAGLLAVYFYRKYRDSRPDGHVFHAMYWFGIPVPGRSFVNPFHRIITHTGDSPREV